MSQILTQQIIVSLLLILNGMLFLLMSIDKKKASRKKRRIPEKTLLLLGVFGGAIGGLVGMSIFRHKTKHTYFYWIYYSALMTWIGVFIYFYN